MSRRELRGDVLGNGVKNVGTDPTRRKACPSRASI